LAERRSDGKRREAMGREEKRRWGNLGEREGKGM
jgi:hypothetical protein